MRSHLHTVRYRAIHELPSRQDRRPARESVTAQPERKHDRMGARGEWARGIGSENLTLEPGRHSPVLLILDPNGERGFGLAAQPRAGRSADRNVEREWN